MSNAKTDLVIKSPNFNIVTNKRNTSIVIHHMAAQWSAQQCANSFLSRTRQASSNYAIGKDGETCLIVDEDKRAWTTSNAYVDGHSVTIEVGNCSCAPEWKISDKAMDSLVRLCADICKRNGIKRLYYNGKNGTLLRHCDFASTSCPGPYIKEHTKGICDRVNALLGDSTTVSNKKVVVATDKPKFKDKKLEGRYKATAPLFVRSGAGVTKDKLVMMPVNKEVKCSGEYSTNNGDKWYYISVTIKDIVYKGFCHSAYLKKK